MSIPAAVYMVNSQEVRLCFSATGTHTAVVKQDFCPVFVSPHFGARYAGGAISFPGRRNFTARDTQIVAYALSSISSCCFVILFQVKTATLFTQLGRGRA